jgi:hypothetical protein
MASKPVIWYNLVTEMHGLLISALRVADDQHYRKIAATTGKLPTDAFAQVRGMANIFLTKLVSNILHGSSTGYTMPSAMYLHLHPDARKRDGSGNTGNSLKKGRTGTNAEDGSSATTGGTTTGGTASTTTPKPGTAGGTRPRLTPDERKKKGLFKWTGSGKIPDCNILFMHHKNKEGMAQMCKDFCYVGKYCNRPDCSFAHIFHKKNLPADKLQAVEKYVSDNAGVEWANPQEGGAPPSSNPTHGSE